MDHNRYCGFCSEFQKFIARNYHRTPYPMYHPEPAAYPPHPLPNWQFCNTMRGANMFYPRIHGPSHHHEWVVPGSVRENIFSPFIRPPVTSAMRGPSHHQELPRPERQNIFSPFIHPPVTSAREAPNNSAQQRPANTVQHLPANYVIQAAANLLEMSVLIFILV